MLENLQELELFCLKGIFNILFNKILELNKKLFFMLCLEYNKFKFNKIAKAVTYIMY